MQEEEAAEKEVLKRASIVTAKQERSLTLTRARTLSRSARPTWPLP